MPTLTVRWAGGGDVASEEEARVLHEVPFAPGDSVRDILSSTPFRVATACMGNGACGLCRIRIEAGDAGAPSETEQLYIESADILEGERLACRVHPGDDMAVYVVAPAPRTEWRSIPDDPDLADPLGVAATARGPLPASDLRPTAFVELKGREPLGLAIDIGTTFVSISLHSFHTGERLASRHGANPQRGFGADVLTRLLGAAKSREIHHELRDELIAEIGKALRNMGIQEGFPRRRVVRITIVANTAILSLFAGRNTELLLRPEHWSRPIDCSLPEDMSWLDDWHVNPKAEVELVQPVAGFVGSDLLAGLVATRVMSRSPGTLYIDFGTNTEMALWDGETLWTTSAAGGPAFEGCGISCGIPAGPGAIHRVAVNGAGLVYDTLPGAKPSGVCGSGIVDLVASLLEMGVITPRGTFSGGASPEGYDVLGDGRIRLKKRDVDVVQMAKSACATGAAILGNLARDGVEVSEVLVAGTFGRHLNIRNAQAIGLLPQVPADRVFLVGNTALHGAGSLLLSRRANEELAAIRSAIVMVNLAERDEFEDLYISNLLIQPSVTDAFDF